MNEQKLKNVKIFADTAESCERMSKTLEEAQAILDKAGEDVANAQAEGKSGWEHLSAAIGALRTLMRPDPDTVPWHTEIDYYLDHEPRLRWGSAGEYRTPKDAIDFVLANPQIDIPPADEPIDPNAPKLVRGDGQAWKAIETDTCGIRRANGTVRAWAIRENAGVEVFAKQHFVDGKPSSCWTFSGTVDCEKVIFGTIVCWRNKAYQIVRFIRNGLLSARLRLRHKRMNRQAKAAAAAPSTKHEAPSTKHEEETQS